MKRKSRAAVAAAAVAAVAIGGVSFATDGSGTPDTVTQASVGSPTLASNGEKSAGEKRGWGPAEPGERRFGEIGARTFKAPKDYKPKVTADQAKAKARDSKLLQSSEGGQLNVELALYSNDVYGDIQPDGTVKPIHQGLRAWVVQTEPVDGTVRGPVDRPRDVSTPACPFTFVIDAETGDHVAAFQTCDEERY